MVSRVDDEHRTCTIEERNWNSLKIHQEMLISLIVRDKNDSDRSWQHTNASAVERWLCILLATRNKLSCHASLFGSSSEKETVCFSFERRPGSPSKLRLTSSKLHLCTLMPPLPVFNANQLRISSLVQSYWHRKRPIRDRIISVLRKFNDTGVTCSFHLRVLASKGYPSCGLIDWFSAILKRSATHLRFG